MGINSKFMKKLLIVGVQIVSSSTLPANQTSNNTPTSNISNQPLYSLTHQFNARPTANHIIPRQNPTNEIHGRRNSANEVRFNPTTNHSSIVVSCTAATLPTNQKQFSQGINLLYVRKKCLY